MVYYVGLFYERIVFSGKKKEGHDLMLLFLEQKNEPENWTSKRWTRILARVA